MNRIELCQTPTCRTLRRCKRKLANKVLLSFCDILLPISCASEKGGIVLV